MGLPNAAKHILDFMKSDGRNFVATWYSVITKGKVAFESVDLCSTDTLNYAIRFMVYVALFGFIIEVPIAALIGLPYENPAYVVTNLTLVLVIWLSYATVLHLGMKWLGGRAQLIQSVSSFCFLTAYFIPIMVLQWPLLKYIMPEVKNFGLVPSGFLENLSGVAYITTVTLYLMQIVLFVYFFVVVFRVLRYVHKLSMARSMIGFLLGMTGVVLVVILISIPLHQTIYNAFQG